MMRDTMTEFDLRALGWVVTRDAFWEIARSLVGQKPRIPLAAMPELSQRWRALQAVAAKPSRPIRARIHLSSSVRGVSAETHAAAVDYLHVLRASCPDLYAPHIVVERCRRALALAIAGFGGAIALGSLTDLDYPLISDAALVLFLMGAWHLVTLFQLGSVRKLVSHYADQTRLSGSPSTFP